MFRLGKHPPDPAKSGRIGVFIDLSFGVLDLLSFEFCYVRKRLDALREKETEAPIQREVERL